MLSTLLFLLMPVTALGIIFTPLEVDNHPCDPEKLKNTISYMCDQEGNVTCNNGWKDPDPENPDQLNRCREAICDPPCQNGACRMPNQCACEIGWDGGDCSKCITKPGCVHGQCQTRALECVCDEGYEGGFCDRPACPQTCGPNGHCQTPGVCFCYRGWNGEDCKSCQKLSGCQHGDCVDPTTNVSRPNSCICEKGWEGLLCDMPKCDPPCTDGKGECRMIGNTPICVCAPGFEGPSCLECQTYPGCPSAGSCIEPYDCDCSNVEDGDLNDNCGIHQLFW